jgi:hypothetical protein
MTPNKSLPPTKNKIPSSACAFTSPLAPQTKKIYKALLGMLSTIYRICNSEATHPIIHIYRSMFLSLKGQLNLSWNQ